MPPSRYTDEDRAAVKAMLDANEGNVKRTARHFGMSPATVRDWKRKWDKEGLPASVAEVLPAVRDELTKDVIRVRDKALNRLEAAIDDPGQRVNVKDLATTYGILTDKARLLEGKPTSSQDTGPGGSLPIAEVRELFAGFARGLAEGVANRDAAISSVTAEEPIDVEWRDVTDEVPQEQAAQLALPTPAS